MQARLVWLQVHEHERLSRRAGNQISRTLTLPAMRGSIADREGRVLATSADADTVYAVPTEIDDPESTARKLCQVLEGCASSKDQHAALVERLSKRRAFTYVKRQVSPEEAEAVVALKLDGIGLRKESRRFYPMRELMAGVLGYVGFDNRGLAGIELQYNDIIRGKDGQTLVYTDAKRHAFDSVSMPPTSGASLELTLDAALQHVVERELARGVAEHRADSGVAVVMDPWTGEVLAMASVPTFNPNAFGEANADHRRNLGVAYTYEPGSTFKTFTASAVIQERVLTPESPIDCAPGYILIGRRRVNDVHRYGLLSFTDVIVKSSNVGAIKAGFRVGAEQMQRYVRRFGFGYAPVARPAWRGDRHRLESAQRQRAGVGVDGLPNRRDAVADGHRGELDRQWRSVDAPAPGPRVLERGHAQGGGARSHSPHGDARDGRDHDRDHGGRRRARHGQDGPIEGYTLAAKTGTAAKLDNGAYSKQKYNSSIVGFFPSRKPAVTVVVVIDTPRVGGYYGGVVAGPVFKRIAEAAIQHIGLPRSINPQSPC